MSQVWLREMAVFRTSDYLRLHKKHSLQTVAGSVVNVPWPRVLVVPAKALAFQAVVDGLDVSPGIPESSVSVVKIIAP